MIRDFSLAPANNDDLAAGAELLRAHRNLVVVGDKAYVSAPVAAELWELAQVDLLTVPRTNQHVQLDPALAKLQNRWRHIVETVASQLTTQLRIETNHAKTFWGLCARLYSKLTAHTVCLYLNRVAGEPDWLRIKHLAVPN